MGETEQPARSFSIGPYRFPLAAAKVHTFRRGEAFWQRLADRHIPIKILRMPTNYPPLDCAGESLAGMGVPDMRGTFGTFTFFTDDALESARDVPGGRIVPIRMANRRASLRVTGPANTIRKRPGCVLCGCRSRRRCHRTGSPLYRTGPVVHSAKRG